MVALPANITDPTLEAMNRALEELQHTERRRLYLGISSIGRPCERELWYGFRWVDRPTFNSTTLKRFDDGHRTEDVFADRLRLVPGLTLLTVDPETGRQWAVRDFGGHLRGHMDGLVLGLLQAPKTLHVWEHKAVGDKKFKELQKHRAAGEKHALQQWDETYYAQAVLYMDYGGHSRHYLTCTTPGGREETSVRTDANPEAAIRLKAKAERIIFSEDPPAKISENPEFWLCRFCDYSDICTGAKAPARTCRTCMHSTAERDGTWSCSWHRQTEAEPAPTLEPWRQEIGCEAHRYLPALVPGEVVAGDEAENWVEYRMPDGSTWRDKG